jgi:hypothetical protein
MSRILLATLLAALAAPAARAWDPTTAPDAVDRPRARPWPRTIPRERVVPAARERFQNLRERIIPERYPERADEFGALVKRTEARFAATAKEGLKQKEYLYPELFFINGLVDRVILPRLNEEMSIRADTQLTEDQKRTRRAQADDRAKSEITTLQIQAFQQISDAVQEVRGTEAGAQTLHQPGRDSTVPDPQHADAAPDRSGLGTLGRIMGQGVAGAPGRGGMEDLYKNSEIVKLATEAAQWSMQNAGDHAAPERPAPGAPS